MNANIRKWGIVVSGLLTAWMGYDLYTLYMADELWGYRTLVFYLSSWFFLALLVFPKLAAGPDFFRNFGWSTLSGILLGVGFPDILPVPWLMFVGFVPLLLLESRLTGRPGGSRQLYQFSYHAFLVWNIVATYWVGNSALGAGVFAIMVNAFLMTLPFMLFHFVKPYLPRIAYAGFISFWITFEYLHHQWELTWPWLTLGNSFAEYPMLVQWYAYTGVFGGTLWILLINYLLFVGLIRRQAQQTFAGPLVRAGLLAVLPMILSALMYYNYEERGASVEVVVVQPNYEPHYEKFTIPAALQIERFLELSEAQVDAQTDYLVFPESSLGDYETHELTQYPEMQRLQAFLSNYPRLRLVTGANAYTIFRKGEAHSPYVRTTINNWGDTLRWERSNIALQLDGSSQEVPIYKKSKLVPGPESFPYKELLFMFEPLVDKLGGTTAGVATQPERSVFAGPAGKIAPVICYESVFGEFFTGYTQKGAEAAFIVTNDGWWDNTAGHRQHLYFASLRAIENRRAIARSANTGISAFINQRGDILQATRYDEATAIKGQIQFNDQITFYVKWGDLLARIALFLSLLLISNFLSKRLRVAS